METSYTGRDRGLRFSERLLVAGTGLALLFTALAPEASAPLNVGWRFVYWSLHIGAGLASAVLAARAATLLLPRLKSIYLVIGSGVVGAFLFAPVALAIEHAFPLAGSGADTDWLAGFADSSIAAAVLVEAFELLPPFLSAWALINLEAIGLYGQQGVTTNPAGDSIPTDAENRSFLARLPPSIGQDIVSVSSDLHYLQVVTRQGRAMVLGALKDVEDTFGDAGLRVHRSHWVHLEGVRRLRKGSKGWHLEMLGGTRIPVSRRKRRDVLERLGADFDRSVEAA